MGWSDSLEERVSDLERQVRWLSEFHGEKLVGKRVRCLTHSVKIPAHKFSYRWVDIRDREGEVVSCSGGCIRVRLDPEVKAGDGEVLVIDLSPVEVEEI